MKGTGHLAPIAISAIAFAVFLGLGCRQRVGIELTPKFTRAIHPVDAADAHILSPANYEKLVDGMTQDEVRAVFATTAPTVVNPRPDEEYELVWQGEGKEIVIRFRGAMSINKTQTGVIPETQ